MLDQDEVPDHWVVQEHKMPPPQPLPSGGILKLMWGAFLLVTSLVCGMAYCSQHRPHSQSSPATLDYRLHTVRSTP